VNRQSGLPVPVAIIRISKSRARDVLQGLRTNDWPSAINQLTDDGPSAINQLTDDWPSAINQLTDDGPSAINQLTDDGPSAINQLTDDGPSAISQLFGEEESNKADPREPSEAGAAPFAGCVLAGPSAPALPPPAMKLCVTRQENKRVTISSS
jgi:hypothetical protein